MRRTFICYLLFSVVVEVIWRRGILTSGASVADALASPWQRFQSGSAIMRIFVNNYVSLEQLF